MKFLNMYTLLGASSIIAGLKIIYTKTISQGNAGIGGGRIFIGDFAYPLGGLFVVLGILALYSIFRQK